MTTYTVLVAPDPVSGGFTLTAPALPGCVSQGDTLEHCLDSGERAIRAYLDGPSGNGADREPVTLHVLALESRDDGPQLQRPPFTRVLRTPAPGADDAGS